MTSHTQSPDQELAERFAQRMERPTSPTLSPIEEMRQRVLECTAEMLSARGITQIALFGAGQHTRPIIRQPWVRFGIRVAMILDDHPTSTSIGGVPIISTHEIELPDSIGAVVISSQHYEDQLFDRAHQTLGKFGVPIVRLYGHDDADYASKPTLDRLMGIEGLDEDDAQWLVENRGERHDATLPMLPPARTELHLRRYDLASERLERIGGRSVADLACGTGYGAQVLSNTQDINYIGVDLDARTIQYAQRRFGDEHRRFICASAISLPIDDNAVDLIASFETIEHIEETGELCAQYARILKPAGILVVSTPNMLGPTPFHVHDFDLQSFTDALSPHFEIVELIAQLPIDEVFDPTLPPGMWRLDPSQVDEHSVGPGGRRPDFLIAIAKHRGEPDPRGLEPIGADEIEIRTNHGRIRYYCPSGATRWRAQTLLTKEPETIDWIDRFDAGDVYWDIGASTGPYVMYAAAAGKAEKILAFEPSPWNWWILAEQIRRSGLSDLIQCYSIAVNEGSGAGTLHMRHPIAGGAGSSFGDPIGESGESFTPSFAQGAIGISIDELVDRFGLPVPNRLKIDVDGIEEQILKGASTTLRDPRLKSVVVELDSSRHDLVERVSGLMRESGLDLFDQGLSASAQGTKSQSICNFIFSRIVRSNSKGVS